MHLPLRTRVLLLVFAMNAAVFSAGLFFELERRQEAARAEQAAELAALLDYTLPNAIVPGGELKVPEILRWPYWKHFTDAILIDRNLDRSRGEVRPQGVFLNPLGAGARRADFDRRGVLEALSRAITEERRVEGRGGVALPVRDLEGNLWGGCWYRLETRLDPVALSWSLVPWFLLSTLVLTLGTFLLLRRSVLDPVAALARGAERLAAGDLGARVPEPRHHDELADLVRRFNAMAGTVQGFNERLEREVREATEQVRRAEAAAMTQRRLAATGELAAGVAHEINNPLGGLLNAAESLARPDLAAERRTRYLELLRTGLERIRDTVGRLLRLAPREVHPAPLDLAVPVRDAIALVQHRAARAGVAIGLALEEGLPPVLGQPNELAQAVLNLLVNALDALEERPGGGRIDVALARAGAGVRLVVADDGPGVRPEDLPRLPDLFFTTKDVGKGTGLGLAIVHHVVAAHGGSVHLSGTDGRGFRVEILLPAWVRPAGDGA